MKIAILRGSPCRDGSSSVLADNFIRGAVEGGHEIMDIDVAHADIHPCTSCKDENGNDAQIGNETPEQSETDTVGYGDQRAEQPEAGILKYDNQSQEQAAENAGRNHAAGNSNPHELKRVGETAEKPAKASLKEKLEIYKAQVEGMGNIGTDKTKGKEAVI